METRNERLSNKQRALITVQQSAINQWSNCKHQAEMKKKKKKSFIKVAIIPQTIFFPQHSSPGFNVVEQVLPAVVDIVQGPMDLCLLSLVAGQ